MSGLPNIGKQTLYVIDTPITDAAPRLAANGDYWIPASVSAKLERDLTRLRTACLAIAKRIRNEGMQGVANELEELLEGKS